MQIQEVERNPKTPEFSEDVIRLLTELCFRPDDLLEPVDLIFEFSSPRHPEETIEIIEKLLEQNIAKKVFITGGMPNFLDSTKVNKPESEIFLEKMNTTKFSDVQFFNETKSTNTLENVTEALKVLDFSNYSKILFIFKQHDSMRGYLSLKKFLPHTKIIQRTFSHTYSGTDRPLTRDTWYTYDFGRSRVWGEFLRIKKYGQRGDIFYDEKIDEIIKRIDELTEGTI